MYLKGEGTVWAAGANSSGQLGYGTTTQRNNPEQVVNVSGKPLSGVMQVSTGEFHTVYLKEDGTVWTAGSNSSGQLGDGTSTDRSNPVRVLRSLGGGVSDVVQVSAGIGQTVMLKADGTVWAAGRTSGGNWVGTTTDRSNPVRSDSNGPPPEFRESMREDYTLLSSSPTARSGLRERMETVNWEMDDHRSKQPRASGGLRRFAVYRHNRDFAGPYHTVYLKSTVRFGLREAITMANLVMGLPSIEATRFRSWTRAGMP